MGSNGTVTVTKQQDLQFGRLVMTGSGGSVLLSANGLPVYTGMIPLGGAPTLARFVIQGPKNTSLKLQLTFPLSGTYGTSGNAKLDTLSVVADNMTAFKQDGTTVQLKLDASGQNAITIGGKLSLNSALPGKANILFPISATVVK